MRPPDAQPVPREWFTGVVFVVGYVSLNEFARLFSPGDIVFLWYPPAALTLVLLWIGRPHLVWMPVLAALISTCASESLWDQPWRALPFALGNGVAYLLGGQALRRFGTDPRLRSRRDALLLLLAATGTTLLAAGLGVAGFLATGLLDDQGVLEQIGRFWVSGLAGVATVAPALLLLRDGLRLQEPGESFLRAAERVLALAVVCACAWVSTAAWSGRLEGSGPADFPPLMLVIVPMVWLALRESLPVVSFAVLAVNVISLAVGADNATTVQRALTLQLVVATTSLVALALATSVNRRVAAETGRVHDALHDRLTGLPNGELFADRVSQALRAARQEGGTTGVLQLGLDDFGTVNDSLGREGGDQLLRAVAWRVATDLPGSETVARLSGDHFGVLVTHSTPEQVASLATGLLRRLEAPVRVRGQAIYPRASLGLATCEDGLQPAEELCQDAESALRRAKQAGGGRAGVKDDDRAARAHRRLVLERELRVELANPTSLLTVYLQPVVDAHRSLLVGHEALLRWTSPTLGPVPPPEAVELADGTGLGADLLRRVLDVACAAAGRLRIAINLSAPQLLEPSVVADVERALATHRLPADRLVLEITESGLVEHDHVVPRLAALRAIGVRVALDDFGTGYSSLAYLTRLPVDELKVDQSFVRELPDSRAALAVVRATVSMARSLGLEVVAEGVEHPEQAKVLREMGCTCLQGHLFGKAGPITPTPPALPPSTPAAPQLSLPDHPPSAPSTPQPQISVHLSSATPLTPHQDPGGTGPD